MSSYSSQKAALEASLGKEDDSPPAQLMNTYSGKFEDNLKHEGDTDMKNEDDDYKVKMEIDGDVKVKMEHDEDMKVKIERDGMKGEKNDDRKSKMEIDEDVKVKKEHDESNDTGGVGKHIKHESYMESEKSEIKEEDTTNDNDNSDTSDSKSSGMIKSEIKPIVPCVTQKGDTKQKKVGKCLESLDRFAVQTEF